MEDLKHEIITNGIDRLSALTGENFHGYRSGIYNVLSSVYEASASPNKKMQTGSETVECWYCHKKYGKGLPCGICGREGH